VAVTARMFNRYQAYKDSGVEWLGEIPAHWEVKRLKFAAYVEAGQSPPSEVVRDGSDGLPFLQGNADFGPASPLPRQVCDASPKHARAGDILLSVRAPVGAMNVADQEYGIGRGLCAIRFGPVVDLRFGFYALSTTRKLLDSVATGSTYDAVTTSHVGDLPQVLPSEPEQRAIAAFLDRETARIDALVAKKERLIELLQEQRTALITRAVTKGLDPTVPMKDSGVEWLGEIPAHWEVLRLKEMVTGIEQGWSPLCENRQADGSEWGVLKVGCVNGEHFDESEHKALPAELPPIPEYEIRPGDILMSRANTRELLGSAALVRRVRPRLLLCDKLYRIRVLHKRVLPEFVVRAVSSHAARFQLEREATGASASMQNISQGTISTLLLPLPSADQQRRIVGFLDREATRIDALIAKVRDAIELLKELRTAVISAAVTGKIDVREEAA
jgi:type I restriction enzyme, S subunit